MRDKLLMAHYQGSDGLIGPSDIPTVLIFYFISKMLFMRNYPTILWSIDLPIAVLSIFYIAILKPMLYTGILRGYYPREYKEYTLDKVNWFSFFAATAVGRILAVFLDGHANIPSDFIYPLFVGSILFSISIFISLFYKTRFVSIKRYTEGTRLIMYSENEKYGHCRLNPKNSGRAFMGELATYKDEQKFKKQRKNMKRVDNDPVLNEMFQSEIKKLEKENMKHKGSTSKEEEETLLRRKNRVEDNTKQKA